MGEPGRSWGCPDSNDGRVHVNGQGVPPIDLESWPGATELFVPLSTGVCALTPTGVALKSLVREAARSAVAAVPTMVLEMPPVIPTAMEERAQYLTSFPHLLGVVRCFDGTRRDHLPLLEAAERDDDWAQGFASAGLVLPPAACHGVYAILADSDVDGVVAEIVATCFRREPSDEATRFQSFDMLEFVCVGNEATVDAFVVDGIVGATSSAERLGLTPTTVQAHDPFFGTAAALLGSEQREIDAKREIIVDGPNGTFAVASVNRHGNHFGELFSIETVEPRRTARASPSGSSGSCSLSRPRRLRRASHWWTPPVRRRQLL